LPCGFAYSYSGPQHLVAQYHDVLVTDSLLSSGL
jgi:hypothetical protein